MDRCRFRNLPGHLCQRRDGRLIRPGDETPCSAECRAQVADVTALAVEVDAALPVSWLLANRSAWGEAA